MLLSGYTEAVVFSDQQDRKRRTEPLPGDGLPHRRLLSETDTGSISASGQPPPFAGGAETADTHCLT